MCPYGTTKKIGFSRNFDLISGRLLNADDGLYHQSYIHHLLVHLQLESELFSEKGIIGN